MKKKILTRKKKKIQKSVEPSFCYKLTEMELDRLTFRGIITSEQRDTLIKVSKMRQPNTYARQRFQVGLNDRGSIMLNSINFYGGEDFGEPYHFLAEIRHRTSKSAFSKFIHWNDIPEHPFTK